MVPAKPETESDPVKGIAVAIPITIVGIAIAIGVRVAVTVTCASIGVIRIAISSAVGGVIWVILRLGWSRRAASGENAGSHDRCGQQGAAKPTGVAEEGHQTLRSSDRPVQLYGSG